MEDVTTLKARAYDLLALIQHYQAQLNQVNQMIDQMMREAAAVPPAVEPPPSSPEPESEAVS